MDIREKKRKKVQENDEIFLLSRGKRSYHFFTEDSRRYITPYENKTLSYSYRRIERQRQFDSALGRFEEKTRYSFTFKKPDFSWKLDWSWFHFRSRLSDISSGISFSISPVRAWNFSLVGAVLFGMISMSMIYRSFGQVASAQRNIPIDGEVGSFEEVISEREGEILGEAIEFIQKNEAQYIEERKEELKEKERIRLQQKQEEQERKKEFQSQMQEMVKGYPIEAMLPAIFKQNDIVAAYLVAIAKKESNWGRRVPVLNGEDCYNYWGYRGIRDRMGSGGHTCFDSPEDAVETVGARIAWFVEEKGRETPEELIVWKCGFSCAGHDSYGVQKWISDVDLYFSKLYKKEESTSAY